MSAVTVTVSLDVSLVVSLAVQLVAADAYSARIGVMYFNLSCVVWRVILHTIMYSAAI